MKERRKWNTFRVSKLGELAVVPTLVSEKAGGKKSQIRGKDNEV